MNPSKHITFNRESLIISASIADIDLSFVKKMDSMAHIYQTDNYFVIQCSNENYMISILSRLESNTSMIRKKVLIISMVWVELYPIRILKHNQ